MQRVYAFFLILFTLLSHAQGEANIWYFGQNAGLDFNSGSPVALTNGILSTSEGCATISTSTGELLFYTDGVLVYNKNHQVMLNGTGLLGNTSSAQSATIVPKPGSATLFYIFTTDNELGTDGFRYSVVDMELAGGNGAVTDIKNYLIHTPTLENIGVTKHGNGADYWIVTHEWNNNNYRAYQLTATGLNLTPVITSIGATVTGTGISGIGIIKIAPSGSKLAFTNSTTLGQVFNFDNSTGVLSNEVTLSTVTGSLHGVAFSPNEALLYVASSAGQLHQFDLTASNIPNSKITIYDAFSSPGQMQVGPDNKIYVSNYNQPYLGVIDNPNVVGMGCNFDMQGISLGGKIAKSGLPSFNQSFFFTPSIVFTDNCVGGISTFAFSTNQTVLSATWDFGDGTSANGISTTHTYQNAGTYSVTLTVNSPLGSNSSSKEITIFEKPLLLNTTVSLKQCDDDNDGFSAFNLNEVLTLLVNNVSGLTFTFHETLLDAQNNSEPILNTNNYINQTVSTDSIFVRVKNSYGCYETATINLIVSTTLIPATFQSVLMQCDDATSGSATDGIATFDFSSVTTDIQALYPSNQLLDIRYYQNLNDALAEQNSILNVSNYTNLSVPYTQTIYVRVDSQVNNECLGLGPHVTLIVAPLPVISPLSYLHCDDDQDGSYAFDTTTLESTLLNGLEDVTVAYFDEDNTPLPTPLPNPFNTSSQIITAKVTNATTTTCSVTTTITFVVEKLPEVFSLPSNLTSICDDESNPLLQDGIASFDTSMFEALLLGGQSGLSVSYFDEDGVVLPSPLPNPFLSATQNLTVNINNPANEFCSSSALLPLIVYPKPFISLLGTELICSDATTFTKTIDAGLTDLSTINNYTYQWFLNDVLLPLETNFSLLITTEGVYKVFVTNTFGCSSLRTITVVSSEKATIEIVNVIELSNTNSISLMVSGLGAYEFSLDNENFQESTIFNDLQAGLYTVYVKDLNGCGTVKKQVSILGIPKYFTPNGDGYNDKWTVQGYLQNSNSIEMITLYDRYGKLLIQFSPLSDGWDGTSNGIEMPSTDYWYVIQLVDGKNITGHFTLKR